MIFLPVMMGISTEKIDDMKEALYERTKSIKHRKKFLIGGLMTLRSLVDDILGGSDKWRVTEATKRLKRLGYITTLSDSDRMFSRPRFFITPKLYKEMWLKEQKNQRRETMKIGKIRMLKTIIPVNLKGFKWKEVC